MNSNTSVLIVEDEAIIAETLRSMLYKMECGSVMLANNIKEFRKNIESGEIDVALLDINLSSEYEGIALAKECKEADIPVVFITSYNDKDTISKAMEVQPLAYINKPFTELDLFKVCELYKNTPKKSGILKIKDGHDTIRIKLDEIKWLKAENVYTHIQTDEKKHLHRSPLKEMLSLLPKDQFVKTHRSYVVNISKVDRVSAEYLFIGEEKIPLSRSQKALVNEKIA